LTFSGTADAFVKAGAIDGARNELRKSIEQWKSASGVAGPLRQTAVKPRPNPYWRGSVASHLMLPPDMVTLSDHTMCWRGVVSPVVCTAGAKVCW
jgi:hypothetical protein